MSPPPRPSPITIGGLMRLVLWIAVGLALNRMGLQFFQVFMLMVMLGGVVGVLEYLLFTVVSTKIVPLRTAGNPDRERVWLERIVAVPSLSSEASKAVPRYMLMVRYQQDRQYAEAEAVGRLILANRKSIKPAFASIVHLRLADCLEALGRRAEADAERILADDCLKGSKEDFLGRQAQAGLFEKENRHAEAYSAYEKGLSLVPANLTDVRAEFMTRLVLTSFNAGRPADTVRWSEAVLALKTKPVYLQAARKMGALAYSNLGRADDAERLTRESAALEPDPAKRSETLGTAASYVFRRGDLDAAERLAHEAEAVSPGTGAIPLFVLAEIAKFRGQRDESIAHLERALAVPPLPIPSAERRRHAITARGLAVQLADIGQFDRALVFIREADAEFANDAKLSPGVDAAAAFVSAKAGNRDAALARISAAEKKRQAIPDANESQRSILWNLGKTAHALGDPALSESFWRGYLEQNPPPVYLPSAYYYLAEARKNLDDPTGAEDFYRRAASTHYGTLHERLARETVGTLATSPPIEHH